MVHLFFLEFPTQKSISQVMASVFFGPRREFEKKQAIKAIYIGTGLQTDVYRKTVTSIFKVYVVLFG